MELRTKAISKMTNAYDYKKDEHRLSMRWSRNSKKMLKHSSLCQLDPDQLESHVAKTQRFYNQILMDHTIEVDHVKVNDIQDQILVGSGRPLADCGNVTKIMIACPEKHKPTYVEWNCHRKICPECYHKELKKLAIDCTERLDSFRKNIFKIVKSGQISYNWQHFTYRHIEISPPKKIYKKFYSKNGSKNISRKLSSLIRDLGIIGCLKITHQYQHDPETRLLDICKDAFHFHLIAIMPYGHLINSDKFYEKTGWTYKNLGKRINTERTIEYQLSHASVSEYPIVRQGEIVIQHGHINTWHNKISYNNFHKVEDIDRRMGVHEMCPQENCDQKRHEWFFNEITKQQIDQGVYIKTIKFYNYFFDDRQLTRLFKQWEEFKLKFIKKRREDSASGDAP